MPDSNDTVSHPFTCACQLWMLINLRNVADYSHVGNCRFQVLLDWIKQIKKFWSCFIMRKVNVKMFSLEEELKNWEEFNFLVYWYECYQHRYKFLEQIYHDIFWWLWIWAIRNTTFSSYQELFSKILQLSSIHLAFLLSKALSHRTKVK